MAVKRVDHLKSFQEADDVNEKSDHTFLPSKERTGVKSRPNAHCISNANFMPPQEMSTKENRRRKTLCAELWQQKCLP